MHVILALFQLQLSSGHRVVILSSMERIVRQSIDFLDQDLAVEIIRQTSAELTQSKVDDLIMTFTAYDRPWQTVDRSGCV